MSIGSRERLGSPELRYIALGLADGLLAQADRWLLVADGRAPRPHGGVGRVRPPLELALEYLRSAGKWLELAARHT